MGLRSLQLFLLLCLFWLSFVHSASLGNETAITAQSSTKRADQQAVVVNTNTGLFFNVYIDTVITPGQPDQTSVLGQLLSVDGSLVTDSIPIWPYGTLPLQQARKASPCAVYSATDLRFLVVFELDPSGQNSPDIYGIMVSGDGIISGPLFVISNSSLPEFSPAAAWNSDTNEYAVTWQQYSSPAAALSIITFNRTSFTAPQLNFGFSGFRNDFPAIQYVPGSKSYLIVFGSADPHTDSIDDLYAVTVGSHAGTLFMNEVVLVSSVFEFNYTTGTATRAESRNPFIIPSGALYCIVWEVDGDSGEDYIAAQYIDGGGLIASDLVSIGANNFIDRNPSGFYSPGGGIFVIFHETGPTTTITNIEAVTLDLNLNILGYYDINALFTNSEHSPYAVGDGLDNNIVVWYHGATTVSPPPGNATRRSLRQAHENAFRDSDQQTTIKRAPHTVMTEKMKKEAFFSTEVLPHPRVGQPLEIVASVMIEEEEEAPHSSRQEGRASQPTPPAFLVAEPIIIIPVSTSGGGGTTTGGNGGDGDHGWVGGIVAIVIFAVAVGIACVLVLAFIIFVVYRNRAQIAERLATYNVKMPSFNLRRDNFQQFNDEDEIDRRG